MPPIRAADRFDHLEGLAPETAVNATPHDVIYYDGKKQAMIFKPIPTPVRLKESTRPTVEVGKAEFATPPCFTGVEGIPAMGKKKFLIVSSVAGEWLAKQPWEVPKGVVVLSPDSSPGKVVRSPGGQIIGTRRFVVFVGADHPTDNGWDADAKQQRDAEDLDRACRPDRRCVTFSVGRGASLDDVPHRGHFLIVYTDPIGMVDRSGREGCAEISPLPLVDPTWRDICAEFNRLVISSHRKSTHRYMTNHVYVESVFVEESGKSGLKFMYVRTGS